MADGAELIVVFDGRKRGADRSQHGSTSLYARRLALDH
jgi:hypothetical protein